MTDSAESLKRYKKEIQSSNDWRDCYSDNFYSAGVNITCLSDLYAIQNTPVQNSSKLRKLFAYGLPCMYSGLTMFDPKLLSSWRKSRKRYLSF